MLMSVEVQQSSHKEAYIKLVLVPRAEPILSSMPIRLRCWPAANYFHMTPSLAHRYPVLTSTLGKICGAFLARRPFIPAWDDSISDLGVMLALEITKPRLLSAR